MTWLEELTEQWGQPRATARNEGFRHGAQVREVWVWFPGNANHLLTVDEGPGDRWSVSLEAHETDGVQVLTMQCKAPQRPETLIRRALGLAGWLPANVEGLW
jgi:hypothetical protein